MIKSDNGVLAMVGPDFVLGAELMSIIDGVVNAQKTTGVNICKKTFECASDTGQVSILIEFANLMKQATEQ